MRRVAIALAVTFLAPASVLAAEPIDLSAPPGRQSASTEKTTPIPAPSSTAQPPGPEAAPPASPPQPPGPPPPAPQATRQSSLGAPPPPDFDPENNGIFEPPAPPEPHHVAPRTALWLGVRTGWFIPLGSLWARCSNCGASSTTGYADLQGVPWRDYSTSGPLLELDAGARLSRNYMVFALWEHAQLGSGNGDPNGAFGGHSSHGDTDFWGAGIRATSNADHLGLITELAIGYRRARATWDDGSQLQLTDAPFEARLGIGVGLRLNEYLTLSPMVSLGVGSFGKLERVSNGAVSDATGSVDQSDSHAWATLNVGGFFDLFGSNQGAPQPVMRSASSKR